MRAACAALLEELESERPLSAVARRHAEGCEGCRALLRLVEGAAGEAGAAPPGTTGSRSGSRAGAAPSGATSPRAGDDDPGAPFARSALAPGAPLAPSALLEEALEKELRRGRARRWWPVPLAATVALVALSLGLSASKGLFGSDSPTWAIVGFTLLACSGLLLAAAPGARTLRWLYLTAAALGALVHPLVTRWGTRPLTAKGFECVTFELAISAIPLALAVVLLMRFAPSPSRALTAGLAAGFPALTMLHLHCRLQSGEHLGLFHVLPWLLVGLAALVRMRMASRTHAP